MHQYSENEKIIVSYTPEELAALPSATDWKRVEAMTDAEITAAALSDPDVLPMTDEELSRPAKRGREALLEILPLATVEEILKTRGRPKVADPKVQVTLRLSPEVLSHFRATGKGWQTRLDNALKDVVAQHRA